MIKDPEANGKQNRYTVNIVARVQPNLGTGGVCDTTVREQRQGT